jgi:hypothetical protein
MNKLINLISLLIFVQINSQNINLNHDFIESDLRFHQIKGELKTDYSFTLRPLNLNTLKEENKSIEYLNSYSKKIFENNNKSISVQILPIDYLIEYSSRHPYNRNNGSMIPNRGYQHLISGGIYAEIGPLTIQLNPEHHFSENREFDGFWEGHYPVIWQERYSLWNSIDLPEKFGDDSHNQLLIGQSSIRLNWKNFSLGISNENIWWGPSIRNSIMMSNHAKGFKHITFNSIKPFKTKIGNFEWQVITGRLESSGFTPPNIDFEYNGTKAYIPKINQMGVTNDWRYLQGFTITYSPKLIKGMSLGFTRWVQMYSMLVKGDMWWLEGNPSWFPAFKNLFRKNDIYENYEALTDQAAGIFLRWLWEDSKAEIYAEFHHNDSKQNLRDLLLDSDHSRAATIGLQKIFYINNTDYLFSWEWTQMEQNASRLIRNAGSWYSHNKVRDGYTNNGEVLGSGIGPGSNSHYFSLKKINNNEKIGIALEVIDNDNDFYHLAFATARDYRRYWKDYNFHLNYSKKFENFWGSANFIYSRSLNYQWELDDTKSPYYHPGNDVNNFHLNFKLTYFFR